MIMLTPMWGKRRVNTILVVNKLQVERTIRLHAYKIYEYVCMYIYAIGFMHLWALSATKF